MFAAESAPVGEVKFTPAASGPGFAFLSWDTEGTAQTKLNLLRATTQSVFQVERDGKWEDGAAWVQSTDAANGQVSIGPKGEGALIWSVRATPGGMTWSLRNPGPQAAGIAKIRVLLPFDAAMAATSVLPSRWAPPDGFELPAVLSAADFGQLLVKRTGTCPVTGRFLGSRKRKLIDVAFEIGAPPPKEAVALEFTSVQLPTPKGVKSDDWKLIQRGWWNVYMPCVGGDLSPSPSDPPPAGVLSNNPISDPVSSLYAFMGDHALLVPELAAGISAEYLLRFSTEWWLDARTDPTGAVVSYYDIKYQLDAPASIVVAAWACVEISGDLKWAQQRIAKLELIGDFLGSRDMDKDGIIESPRSGNPNDLKGTVLSDRGATAWDAINSGHKEIYINALAFRAFCCLADLELKLGRQQQARRYAALAASLKKAFMPTFFNPKTGSLSWWISADGKRRDYPAPGVLALPIAYGLVPDPAAGEILARLRQQVRDVKFTRLDLGLPAVLTPIRKEDYAQTGAVWGSPRNDDGSDTFEHYLNGGCCVSDQIHWFNAHFRIGAAKEVMPQLSAMIARQGQAVFPNGGSFQNGIVDRAGKGAEFYTWTGEPCGYEGHLVYSWFPLQGVLTQHRENLNRIFRPMFCEPGK
jgi:hypothetical protein